MTLSGKKRRRELGVMVGKYAFALVLITFAVVPFLWIVSTSFNPSKSLINPRFFPPRPTLGNYKELLLSQTMNYSRWLLNSFKVTTIAVVIIVSLTTMAAYVLSRFRFPSKKYLMMGIMVLNIFPGILAMIAIYTLLRELGAHIPLIALNTHGGLIAVYISFSMSINVLMVKAYIDTLPAEIDESALVEGASYGQVFWKLIFPLIRPMVVTVGILTFMAVFGDFIIANILLKGNDKITVMVGVFKFTQDRFDIDWGLVTAGAVLPALPVLTLFFFVQRAIIDGLTSGSVKQ